jgi:transcriptional regulator with XRE-family HTH domain
MGKQENLTESKQRLRDLMQREGLTSRDVAELVGVHPVTVRKWMCGESRVPQAVLMVLGGLEKSQNA